MTLMAHCQKMSFCPLYLDQPGSFSTQVMTGARARPSCARTTSAGTGAPVAEHGRIVGTVQGGVLIGLLSARVRAGVLADLAGWRTRNCWARWAVQPRWCSGPLA